MKKACYGMKKMSADGKFSTFAFADRPSCQGNPSEPLPWTDDDRRLRLGSPVSLATLASAA